MREILNKNISILKFDNVINNLLNNNEINTIYKLCNYSRMELSEIGFSNIQINKIIINLQLKGLDLKANHAIKNAKTSI